MSSLASPGANFKHRSSLMPYQPDTLLTLLGRENTEETYGFGSVSPPVFRTSTVIMPNYDAFEAAMEGRFKGIT